MAWTTPVLVEICIGLEINGYLPAELIPCYQPYLAHLHVWTNSVICPKVLAAWPDQSSHFLISLEDYVFSAK